MTTPRTAQFPHIRLPDDLGTCGRAIRPVLAVAVLCAWLAGCVPATRQPPPTPLPQPRPVPAQPAPAAPPAVADWTLAPLTPGSWRYVASPTGGSARFGPIDGPAVAALICDRATRLVRLSVAEADAQPLVVRTSFGARTVTAGGAPAMDRLWDEMAFSRGRFRIDPPAGTPIIVPAWPEVARVIEDCRR